MLSLLAKVAKSLRIGKSRYIVGYDLAGNSYVEMPSLFGSKDPRHTRRAIQWLEQKHAGDYDQRSLPVQWTMWLRHTRRDAPTIQELEADVQRRQTTLHNARILAIKDLESKQREDQAKTRSQRRVSIEKPSEFRQERVTYKEVWATSRARLADQGQIPIHDELKLARQRRAAKRASQSEEDNEKERARREMAKSPLEAFVPAPKRRQ